MSLKKSCSSPELRNAIGAVTFIGNPKAQEGTSTTPRGEFTVGYGSNRSENWKKKMEAGLRYEESQNWIAVSQSENWKKKMDAGLRYEESQHWIAVSQLLRVCKELSEKLVRCAEKQEETDQRWVDAMNMLEEREARFSATRQIQISNGSSSPHGGSALPSNLTEQIEVLKQQLSVSADDFSKERSERIQAEKEAYEDQIAMQKEQACKWENIALQVSKQLEQKEEECDKLACKWENIALQVSKQLEQKEEECDKLEKQLEEAQGKPVVEKA